MQLTDSNVAMRDACLPVALVHGVLYNSNLILSGQEFYSLVLRPL